MLVGEYKGYPIYKSVRYPKNIMPLLMERKYILAM